MQKYSERSSTTKVNEYISCVYSMSTCGHLVVYKMSMIYTEVNIAWKNFVNP